MNGRLPLDRRSRRVLRAGSMVMACLVVAALGAVASVVPAGPSAVGPAVAAAAPGSPSLPGAAAVFAAPMVGDTTGGSAFGASAASTVAPRLLVKTGAGAAPLDERLDLAAWGLRVVRRVEALGIWVLEVEADRPAAATRPLTVSAGAAGADRPDAAPRIADPHDADPGDVAARVEEVLVHLRSTPGVVWAEPESARSLSVVPNDPYYAAGGGHPGQWGTRAVGLETAWDEQTGSSSVVIAVLDSGIGRDIADFAGRLVSPYSAAAQSEIWPAWEDAVGHGSGTAGVAAATGDNGIGIAGASWGSAIMPVHLTDDDQVLSDVAEIDGIVWAVDHGADVLNLSFGSPDPSPGEQEAIDYALGKGVVVVASAGNTATESGVWYPAAYDGVIAVGATDAQGSPAAFSSYGTGLDLMAPGVDIVTWGVGGSGYGMYLMGGTSFSAPLVSGVAALMLAEDPGLTRQEINTILCTTAEDMGAPGWDALTGYGRLDAAEAVRAAATWHAPSPPVERPPLVFSDVPAGHPYAGAIGRLSVAGVVEGYADGRFGLTDHISRQQFAKMIVLALGLTPTEQMTSPFSDVPRVAESLYPDNYVALAHLLGITRGTSADPPRFSPWAAISRAQVTSMVVRAADAVAPGSLAPAPTGYLPPFGRFSTVHDGAAARASYGGLLAALVGMGPTYDMWLPATRGEVAAMLAPLLDGG